MTVAEVADLGGFVRNEFLQVPYSGATEVSDLGYRSALAGILPQLRATTVTPLLLLTE